MSLKCIYHFFFTRKHQRQKGLLLQGCESLLGAFFVYLWKCAFVWFRHIFHYHRHHIPWSCWERLQWGNKRKRGGSSQGCGRYGRLHVYPSPDLMSDRERSMQGARWTWQWAMINHVCVWMCVSVLEKKRRWENKGWWGFGSICDYSPVWYMFWSLSWTKQSC